MQVKSPCPYYLLYRIRHQITYRLVVSDAFPDKSSGYVEHRRVDHFNVRMLFKF